MSDHKVSIASVIGTSTNDTTLTGARGEGMANLSGEEQLTLG